MKADKDQVRTLVYEVIDELNEQFPDRPIEKSDATRLFGLDGVVDSLGLVHLIVGVEQAVNDRFGAAVALASEKAISMEHSPFQTVGRLIDFVVEQLRAQADG